MFQAIAKYVGGRVLTAVIVVAAAAAIIWYWQLPPDAKEAIWRTVGYGALWLLIAALLPWATFFVVPAVLKAESNLVSALFVLALWLVDIAIGCWLAGGEFGGVLAWGVAILGFLAAGVYNLLVCDFLAERAEDTP